MTLDTPKLSASTKFLFEGPVTPFYPGLMTTKMTCTKADSNGSSFKGGESGSISIEGLKGDDSLVFQEGKTYQVEIKEHNPNPSGAK